MSLKSRRQFLLVKYSFLIKKSLIGPDRTIQIQPATYGNADNRPFYLQQQQQKADN
jgi:hypothetical protein